MSENQTDHSHNGSHSSEDFGSAQNTSETFGDVAKHSESFGTIRNDAEEFGTIPQVSERGENHTLTVKEVARMFEAAGVARTERSIINWCQPNRQGIKRLDSYYDPNERKYYISPQSVETVIQEEIQRSKKTTETIASETFGSPVAHVKHLDTETSTPDKRRIQELENELLDFKIANEGKHQMIEFLKRERLEYIAKIQETSRQVGQLETKLLALDSGLDEQGKQII